MPDEPKNPDDFEFPSLHNDPEEAKKDPPASKEADTPKKQQDIDELSKSLEDDVQTTQKKAEASGPTFVSKNKNFVLIGAFVILALAIWGIQSMRSDPTFEESDQSQPTDPSEIPVNVIEARLGRFQHTIETVGNLKGENEIELRFQMEGIIQALNVTDGQRIKRGQLIAKLIDRDVKNKVQKAKVPCEQYRKLYRLGGVSKTKVDEVCLELEVALAELEKSKLYASKDGIIGDIASEVGEYVSPQKKIGTLVTIKNVVVNVGIIEKEVDKVYPGQKILVTVDAYPGDVFEGVIDSISPIVSGDSRTFEIKAKIPNENSVLLPGMFARAKIIVYEADDAISVPNDALVKTSGGFQVFVVNKDNIAEERDVDVGYVSTENTQIERGVDAGEIVVVQKPPELKTNMPVKIIEVQK